MLRLRTTSLPSKDLLSPSTSIAICFLPSSFLGMAEACGRFQADGHRLAHAQVLRLLGTCLDTEHQASALLAAVDDRRRKLRLRRNKADARDQPRLAAVAVHLDRVVDFER